MPAVRVKEAAEHRRPVEAGKQSQSTEPSRLTSAAERQSESRAYSPTGKLFIMVPLMIGQTLYAWNRCGGRRRQSLSNSLPSGSFIPIA